jgi:hypothetical protein
MWILAVLPGMLTLKSVKVGNIHNKMLRIFVCNSAARTHYDEQTSRCVSFLCVCLPDNLCVIKTQYFDNVNGIARAYY